MPPSKKRRVPAPASRSAAGSRAGGDAQHGEREAQPRGLDPTAVKGFLKMIQQSDRLGPEFLTDDERQQWDEWLDGTPASAEDSPDGRTLFPLQIADAYIHIGLGSVEDRAQVINLGVPGKQAKGEIFSVLGISFPEF